MTVVHGHFKKNKKSPEYRAYYHAKWRCTSQKCPDWKYYGGRGVKFLLPDFATFLATIGLRPSKKHSLDRENNNGNYTLQNVRWATRNEQNKNRRSNGR